MSALSDFNQIHHDHTNLSLGLAALRSQGFRKEAEALELPYMEMTRRLAAARERKDQK